MDKLESLKKKIIYRSNYRGTKELDLILSGFVKKYIHTFTETELEDLSKFLDNEDEVIYEFYQNTKNSNEIKKNKVTDLFKTFKI